MTVIQTYHQTKVSKHISFVKHLWREPQIWSNILRSHSDWTVVLIIENIFKCPVTIIWCYAVNVTHYPHCTSIYILEKTQFMNSIMGFVYQPTLNISMHHLHTYKFSLMEYHHRGEKLNLRKNNVWLDLLMQ